MEAKRVGGEDVRAGRGVLGVDLANEVGSIAKRPGAPKRRARVGPAPGQLGPHCGIEEKRPARMKRLADGHGGIFPP